MNVDSSKVKPLKSTRQTPKKKTEKVLSDEDTDSSDEEVELEEDESCGESSDGNDESDNEGNETDEDSDNKSNKGAYFFSNSYQTVWW